jgi:thiosulfate/3-mercaptopyruvate sulfurtransferase
MENRVCFCLLLAAVISSFPLPGRAQSMHPAMPVAAAFQAAALPKAELITPEELANILRSPRAEKPLIVQVGFHILYLQGHIAGAHYEGPASKEEGLKKLRKWAKSLPRDKFIVIYCGCCPWVHCPNVKPAADALHKMGFTRVRTLYIEQNFAADWADKGYPVEKGQ